MKGLVVALVFAASCKGETATDDFLVKARFQIYSADFVQAEAALRQAEANRPDDPRPPFFRSLNELWQLLYFGYSSAIAQTMTANAARAIRKADHLIAQHNTAAEPYLWRGLSRSLQIASTLLPETLGPEHRQMSLNAMVTRLSVLNNIQAAKEDFQQAANTRTSPYDAQAMLTLLTQCQSPDSESCVGGLWTSIEKLEWIGNEISFVVLNTTYNQRAPAQLRLRAAPLAIGLHLTYPDNGLFHLTLAKLSYEIGDRQACRDYASDILSSRYAGVFGEEARYLLGLTAGAESDWTRAGSFFQQIVNAAPQQPPYLVPWALLRLAQTEEALGQTEAAQLHLRRAMASGSNNAALMAAAWHLMKMLDGKTSK